MNWRVAIALVVLATLHGVSHAQVTTAGPSVAAVSNGWQVSYAGNGTPLATATRTYAAGAASGEALVRDMFGVQGRAGTMAVTATRAVRAGCANLNTA